MELFTICSLPVASTLWRRSASSWVQTIVCKATFDLLPGVATLSEQQEPINEEDHFWDDDPGRSLYAPSDLAPVKARADVLLVGRAFAPGGGPTRSVVARLGAGKLVKSIEVFGLRTWDAGGALREEAPFSSMSLAYEHAAGGPDTWNPVGMRLGAGPEARGGAALPNLQPLGEKLGRRGDFIPPIGFGPISPSWPLRAHLLGPHRKSFSLARLGEEPLPEDFEEAYFNAAPPDQQVDEIFADEQLFLENLHPEHAQLSTRLPGVRPQVLLEMADARRLRMRGDTLWIDTDRGIVTLTWRGQVPLHSRDEAGHAVVALEGREREESPLPGRPVETVAAPRAAEASMTMPMATPLVRVPPLPFVRAEPAREAPRAPEPLAPPLVVGQMAASMPAMVREVGPVEAAREAALPVERGAAPPPMSVGEMAVRTPAAREVAPGPVLGAAGGVKEPALVGVLAASDAAAGASRKAEKNETPAGGGPAAKAGREAPKEILELLWYDPAALPRIRRNPAWKKIIGELKPRPSDDDFDGGLPADQMKAAKDKRDVFGVLARGEVMGMEGIRRAMEMAVLDDGSFVPPYVLTAGVLEFLFDEMEVLKATLVAVAPFVPLDKKLKETVDYVNEVMKTPGLERARAVVEGLCAKVKAAFAQAGRGVSAGYLEEQVEGMLLEGKCYQTRTAMGQKWMWARFRPTGAQDVMPTYLPEALKAEFPALLGFSARGIAEGRTNGNQGLAPELSLKMVALGRLLSR